MSSSLPAEHHAARIAQDALGWSAATAQRFTTGMGWFVFDVSHGAESAVVRIGRPEQADALGRSMSLMERLRRHGVPLPQILASGRHDGFPFMVMTRLAGTDLGHVVHSLPAQSLTRIAEAVADAQLAAARSTKAIGFGYAATAESAPHASWTDVVRNHVERSRHHIVANGLFPVEAADRVEQLLARHAPSLDRTPPTPFLHDTTTKNVIVAPDGTLSGIVDVDDLCFGDPRYAPALTAAAFLTLATPLDYVRTWLARVGATWDAVFDFYVAAFLLDFMAEHGTVFNGNEQASDPAERQRLGALFEAALVRAG